jgi:hypothetical protein
MDNKKPVDEMSPEELKIEFPGIEFGEPLDNSEWVAGVKKGEALLDVKND